MIGRASGAGKKGVATTSKRGVRSYCLQPGRGTMSFDAKRHLAKD